MFAVPPEVEHSLIWSRAPFFCLDIVPESIRKRIGYYGVWGFTGSVELPPPPSTLPDCIGALSEWGMTLDKLKIPPTCNSEDEALLQDVGRELGIFIVGRWPEDEWETAWFVNPPVRTFSRSVVNSSDKLQRLQSVPELSHVHVFARRKGC